MVTRSKILKICCGIVVALTAFNIIFVFTNKSRIDNEILGGLQVDGQVIQVDNEVVKKTDDSEENRKIDWNDYDFIKYEKTRTGPGENNEEYIVTDPEEIKKNENWVKLEGFYVEVSNKISLTRALPDHYPKVCETKKYFEKLPNASVIVTFHNEMSSTLLRCVHSIYNRSPKSLLHEIVLINDNSTNAELYMPLRSYLKNTFGDKVKLYENTERQGLIKARMTGAKKATGEVLVFLDSHMEVYPSWLPPLLDPLVTHPDYATVPVADGMSHKTLKPSHTGYGYRGMFDWNFRYQWFPLRPEDKKIEGEPYQLPCLTGGHYAIRRDHFFYLGGYDEGLQIWNGENYELCLKLWLCKGGLVHTPCSRVAHLSKLHSAHRYDAVKGDFVGRNLKRVAEVWLDDYKQYFYRGDPKRFASIDPGNLTMQFEKKKSLQCKPFSYYADVIAPDFLMRYPIKPRHFAAGKIENELSKNCLTLPNSKAEPLSLMECNKTSGNNFILAVERSIRYNDTNDQCLTFSTLKLSNCHHMRGSQLWRFHLDSRQIENTPTHTCLTANNNTIVTLPCDAKLPQQKWRWTYENTTALLDWENSGV